VWRVALDHLSAARPWRWWQRIAHAAVLPSLALLAWSDWELFGYAVSLLLLLSYGLVVGVKVLAVLAGLLRRHTVSITADELAAQDMAQLPVYTVLVPLYREAAVLDRLLVGLRELDYPSERLDVKLLLEADDDETADALAARELPGWIEVLTVPDALPKTKPRACNAGLLRARGDYVVIFDAEDRPEPDQLRKAVAAFAQVDDEVVCFQAKLNFDNRRRNLLTRCFALEYSTWFDLYLPGLHALGAPIPLGGTSNHFKADALRELGGWDAYNVTEDCDLGIRMAWRRWRTRILASTTWEEAPARYGSWLRQRSRWIKGYWQTYLVHTAQPWDCLRALGLWKTALMLLTVGGQVFSLLVNPLCWALLAAWIALGWPLFDAHQPWTLALVVGTVLLLFANALLILIHALGAMQRRFHHLLPAALLMPWYWLLLSIGAWRGFLQFFSAPFYWEKTPHGEDAETAPREAVASTEGSLVRRLATLASVLAGVLLIGAVAWRMPGWLDYHRQVRLAAVSMVVPAEQLEVAVEQDWFQRETLRVTVGFDRVGPPPEDGRVLRVMLSVKVWDGEWYQRECEAVVIEGEQLRLRSDLTAGWTPFGQQRPWSPACLRRVRALGVALHGDVEGLRRLRVEAFSASGERPLAPLQLTDLQLPDDARVHEQLELRFRLSRHYRNPFDPDEIAVDATVIAPSGARRDVPGFYAQDYRRDRRHVAERLGARGAPYWAVRCFPQEPGAHRIQLRVRDRHGAALDLPAILVPVADGDGPGHVRVDPDDHRYFERPGTGFFYPFGLNIRSPSDNRARMFGIEMPDDSEGTYALDPFISRMAAHGMNMGRVWMAPWFCGLEWRADWPGYHGLGFYNLQNAWRVDHLLDHAHAQGMVLELALNPHGPFTERYDSQWRENPFNARNGGPCARHEDVLRDAEAKRLFRNRFRYCIARYGAHPALYAWTLWIEVNVVARGDQGLMMDWHQEFAPWFRALDNERHPVSTEFSTGGGNRQIFELPAIDYAQIVAYTHHPGLVGTFQRAARFLRHGKPAIIEEYAGRPGQSSKAWTAHEIHDGLWAGWMLPFGGAPMPWWWNLIFAEDLLHQHARFADYITDEDLSDRAWRYQRQPVAGTPLQALVRAGDRRAYAWIFHPALSDSRSWRDYDDRLERLGADFDATDEQPGQLWRAVEGATLDTRSWRLRPGRYRVEVWDTWERGAPEVFEIELGAQQELSLPPLRRDCALKLIALDEP